jgi:hypothetical protein
MRRQGNVDSASNILIIDSPPKNISDDENPDLVQSLYREIYRLASAAADKDTQLY